jgi:hypothetical protein
VFSTTKFSAPSSLPPYRQSPTDLSVEQQTADQFEFKGKQEDEKKNQRVGATAVSREVVDFPRVGLTPIVEEDKRLVLRKEISFNSLSKARGPEQKGAEINPTPSDFVQGGVGYHMAGRIGVTAGSTASFNKGSWVGPDRAKGRPSSTEGGTGHSSDDDDVRNIRSGFRTPVRDDDASSLDASYMNAIDPNLLQKQQESNNAEETNVDEMKIQTMYKMVEDCQVEVEGRDVLKKVLYLTNKQASLIDEQAMERCIQALDIGQPKFIIRLCPSIGVESQNNIAHSEMKGTAMDEFKSLEGDISSELDKGDERIVESQILLFMRTCILPLARQTRALIMVNGANDCYLSAALSEIALAEQARLGKDCPFTVIATCSEDEVHHKAAVEEERESLAGQISRKTATWAKRISQCHR